MSNTILDFSSAYYLQTNGQTEVVNRSLGDLLRSLLGDHLNSWDKKLFKVEFAYNRSINRSICFSPFFIVYGANSCAWLDLALVPDLKRVNIKAKDLITYIYSGTS